MNSKRTLFCVLNNLTLLRDLVYQSRYTESYRLLYSSPDKKVLKQYIRGHSDQIPIPYRRTFWLDGYRTQSEEERRYLLGAMDDFIGYPWDYQRGSGGYGHHSPDTGSGLGPYLCGSGYTVRNICMKWVRNPKKSRF